MYNSYSDFPWQQHFESFRSSIAGSRVRDFVVGDFGFGILEVPGLASHLLVVPATGFTVPLFFEKRSCRCGGVLISVYFGSTQMTRLFCVLCGRVVRKGLRACVVSYGVLV